MATRGVWRRGTLNYYDSVSQETTGPIAPVVLYDDFLGNALNDYIWTHNGTAGATQAMVAAGANGALALALTATNEVQLSGIDFGSTNKSLVLNQGLQFEARIKLAVIPTGSVVVCIGLCGTHDAAVNTVAESIWFRFGGSGAATVETDDTANETSLVATGTTLTTADWAILRIDCSDIANVRFYINGNRVASGTTFNMSTVAALALQPVLRIGKESAQTAVGTLHIDYVRCWQNRSA